MPSSSTRRAAAPPSRTTATCWRASPSMPSGPPRSPAMTRDVTEFLGQLRHGAAQALVVAAGRLSLGLLDAARPAHHRGAAQAPAQRRLHRGRGSRGPPVLRLGRHLQHPAAGDRRRPARPQGRQHQARAPRRRSRPATSAASRSWPAAWTSPSPTPSSCSTGPTAARCRAGSRRSPSTCKTCPSPSRCSPCTGEAGLWSSRPRPRERSFMRIGVPKEIKVHEYRVGMTPGERARGGGARPPGVRRARRRRAPGHLRRRLPARRRQGRSPQPPRSSPRPTSSSR